ncbi:hypothetical protein AB205_0035760 [Aquarana catesbeiana]|uniref:Uncharacterized protein n=1 Tax=Aquarana catesbeiana TaxID=8400 RepID=A0A2G9S9L8_AQUCT|nr:hypothetical protein AB205_0035760 [Aquarana catesbeiana]
MAFIGFICYLCNVYTFTLPIGSTLKSGGISLCFWNRENPLGVSA